MNVLDKLKDFVWKDFDAEENEDGGVSYDVEVKSSAREVFSE